MSKFLVIGDLHGSYRELNELLSRPEADNRFIVFLGDLIDRGAEQQETLQLVRGLIESQKAVCIMGNHEYNAIMYSLGLRHRDDVHNVFLEAFPQGSDTYPEAISFLRGLPLWVDYPAFSAIHACYLKEQLEIIRPYLDAEHAVLNGQEDDRFFHLSRERKKAPLDLSEHDPRLEEAVHISLKGTEYNLSEEYYIRDKDGTKRSEVRTRWWLDKTTTLTELAFNVDSAKLPDLTVDAAALGYKRPSKPVFVGHYWLKVQTPQVRLEDTVLLHDLVYCLDFSCVKGGHLCGMCVDTKGEQITGLKLLCVKKHAE